jgi:hypothetical protein
LQNGSWVERIQFDIYTPAGYGFNTNYSKTTVQYKISYPANSVLNTNQPPVKYQAIASNGNPVTKTGPVPDQFAPQMSSTPPIAGHGWLNAELGPQGTVTQGTTFPQGVITDPVFFDAAGNPVLTIAGGSYSTTETVSVLNGSFPEHSFTDSLSGDINVVLDGDVSYADIEIGIYGTAIVEGGTNSSLTISGQKNVIWNSAGTNNTIVFVPVSTPDLHELKLNLVTGNGTNPGARSRSAAAARCRPRCSTCAGRLGGAAAADRTMVRSPAAPSVSPRARLSRPSGPYNIPVRSH